MNAQMFHSRDERYKTPFGAVAAGTSVHLRIRLPRELKCSAARVSVHDEIENADFLSDMFWCGMADSDGEWWETDVAFEQPGLYFYRFTLTTAQGERSLGRAKGGGAELAAAPIPWQQTVYAADFVTPDWLDGGIIYQIFPDSFCKSGKKHTGVPEDRRLLAWDAPVHWQPDEDGEYRNNRFYGGDLAGITSRLDHLQSLGVSCLYLNPIFESADNHRYSTADYTRIDPLLGSREDFVKLCREAKKRGIRVILDGVFSHTGSDSVYFNREGRYGSEGAYNSQGSPYASWYSFRSWPNDYDAWWGFKTLPELRETDGAVMEFMNGEEGITRRWLREGAAGWRLDVADELPDEFLDSLRAAVKAEKPDSLIIGEVWEDASNKISYSRRRRYLLGRQLDSVMNYCFKDAILAFMHGADAADAVERLEQIMENYPPQVTRLLMNLMGTHDTERLITALAGESSCGRGRDWQHDHRLSDEQRARGREREKLVTLLQYTVPGVPSVYYGDEAGLEGYRDPFNRAPYPWGGEDNELLEWYRTLGRIRRSLDCFTGAQMQVVRAQGRVIAYIRRGEHTAALTAVNAGEQDETILVPEEFRAAKALVGEYGGEEQLCIPAGKGVLLALDSRRKVRL